MDNITGFAANSNPDFRQMRHYLAFACLMAPSHWSTSEPIALFTLLSMNQSPKCLLQQR